MPRASTWKMQRTCAGAVALAACGCDEARAPAHAADRPASSATEWAGARAHPPAPHVPAAGPAPTSDRGTWVLNIGDSFADASFQQNIAPHVRASGAAFMADSRVSTYTTTWAYDAQLDEKLARRPSLVIVTLGANEVDIPYPSVHAGAVERIARRIQAAGASCVWTTPPLWHGETGILEVIHDHCAPCVYFDSDAVLGGGLHPDERQRDGIHPNPRGGARWAEAFWGWLNDHRDATQTGWRVLPFERRDPS